MPRIRQIKPEMCTSADSAALSRDARLFFLLLLTEADDKGRLIDSPKRLAGCLYPHDEDVTARKVTRWLDECVTRDMIRPYEVSGLRCLSVTNFEKHQRISHPAPSKLPPPPGAPPEDSGETPEPFPRDSGPVLGRGRGRGRGRGNQSSSTSDSRPPPASPDDDQLETSKTEAVRLLAERRLAAREATKGQVGNRDAWLAEDRRRTADLHRVSLAAVRAVADPERLADLLEPPPARPPALAPFRPLDLPDLAEVAAEAPVKLAALRGTLRSEEAAGR